MSSEPLNAPSKPKTDEVDYYRSKLRDYIPEQFPETLPEGLSWIARAARFLSDFLRSGGGYDEVVRHRKLKSMGPDWEAYKCFDEHGEVIDLNPAPHPSVTAEWFHWHALVGPMRSAVNLFRNYLEQVHTPEFFKVCTSYAAEHREEAIRLWDAVREAADHAFLEHCTPVFDGPARQTATVPPPPAEERAEENYGDDALESPASRWNMLSDLQRECLQALFDNKVFDVGLRWTAETIVKQIGGSNENYKQPLANLVHIGSLESKTGREGGYWLTEAGKRLVEKHGKDAKPCA